MNREEGIYDEWFSDNRIELMSDFIENQLTVEEEKKWIKYCKDEYRRYRYG